MLYEKCRVISKSITPWYLSELFLMYWLALYLSASWTVLLLWWILKLSCLMSFDPSCTVNWTYVNLWWCYSDSGGFCAMKEVLLVSDDSKSNESVKQLSQVCFLALALCNAVFHGSWNWYVIYAVTTWFYKRFIAIVLKVLIWERFVCSLEW